MSCFCRLSSVQSNFFFFLLKWSQSCLQSRPRFTSFGDIHSEVIAEAYPSFRSSVTSDVSWRAIGERPSPLESRVIALNVPVFGQTRSCSHTAGLARKWNRLLARLYTWSWSARHQVRGVFFVTLFCIFDREYTKAAVYCSQARLHERFEERVRS